jgi:hypothetical protein
MRSTKYIFALLVTVTLGYGTFIGHALLGAYVAGHLPYALFLSGFGLLLLPGLGAALVTGFLLAALARLIIPRFAVVVPVLATLPWVALHILAWTVYGSRDIWWVVLSDIASLMIATYTLAILLRRIGLGDHLRLQRRLTPDISVRPQKPDPRLLKCRRSQNGSSNHLHPESG